MSTKAHSLFDPSIVIPALADSVKKLNPAVMIKNPVMFVTMVGAAITTVEIFVSSEPKSFTVQISVWLWFTVLFANFAEAMAEGRGKAQAGALRQSRTKTVAKLLRDNGAWEDKCRSRRSCARATSSGSPPARSSPATAK